MKGTLESFGATDIGLRRQINQDCIFLDDEIGLYVVADGMGGHSAGEVASKLAVDIVHAFVVQNRVSDQGAWPFGLDAGLSSNGNCLRTAIMLANLRIWEQSEINTDLSGMGTTIVAALAEDGVLTVASAGDSRAYRIRGQGIQQITTDDSWVQAALDKGVLSRDQVRDHVMRNVITKAVGTSEDIEPRVVEERLQTGDTVLFCSDGLHGMVSDAEILGIILAAGSDIRKAVADLISAANGRGGKDNITVLLLRQAGAAS
jgi:protein phosphatase